MKKASKISPQSAPGRSLDPHRLSAGDLEDVLGVPHTTRQRWVQAGCPQNQDGTYDAAAVHRWALERAEHRGSRTEESGELDRLRGERMRREITLRDIDIECKRKETMLRSEHENILAGRAQAWQNLVYNIMPRMAMKFVGLADADAARKELFELAKATADIWLLRPGEERVVDDGVEGLRYHNPQKESGHV